MYDVAWSPIHPAVFATVDGMGRLDVWNLNQDTEVNMGFNCCLFFLIILPREFDNFFNFSYHSCVGPCYEYYCRRQSSFKPR